MKKITRILLIIISIPVGWFLGQFLFLVIILLLQELGLDDNLFRFLDSVSLF